VKAATLHRSDFVQQNVANTKTNTCCKSCVASLKVWLTSFASFWWNKTQALIMRLLMIEFIYVHKIKNDELKISENEALYIINMIVIQ
jgi:hypothetical protein